MKKRFLSFVLFALPISAVMWACSSPPYYPGGGRDLGPQAMPMNSDAGTPDGATDTGVTDTGVKDTGTMNDAGAG